MRVKGYWSVCGYWIDISGSINSSEKHRAYIYSIMQHHFYKPFTFNGKSSFRCRVPIRAINLESMVVLVNWYRKGKKEACVGQCQRELASPGGRWQHRQNPGQTRKVTSWSSQNITRHLTPLRAILPSNVVPPKLHRWLRHIPPKIPYNFERNYNVSRQNLQLEIELLFMAEYWTF